MSETWITVAKAVERLKVSRQRVHFLAKKANRLRWRMVGRLLMLNKSDVDERVAHRPPTGRPRSRKG